jgi:hypothetical protein
MFPSASIVFVVMLCFNAWQPSAVDDSSFAQPSVSYQWRSKHTQASWKKIKFPIKYPLTVEQIQAGMPKLSPQELHRFLPLITRLSQQQRQARKNRTPLSMTENVTVVSLGGSFALGTQCCVGNSWPNRFVEWLRAAYPLVNIHHIEYLRGSTNSLYGASVVRELFDTVHVDLLLLGYALNDEVMTYILYIYWIYYVSIYFLMTSCNVVWYQAAIFMSGNKTFISVTEQIVRRAVSSNTAVLYLVETLASSLAQNTYRKVLPHYSVPMVSYRRAIQPHVKMAMTLKENDPNVHFMKSRFSIFWPKYFTAPHPNW